MDDLLVVTEGTKVRYGSGKGFSAPAGLERIFWSPSCARWPWRGFSAGHPFVWGQFDLAHGDHGELYGQVWTVKNIVTIH
jgi:hypothetical protein